MDLTGPHWHYRIGKGVASNPSHLVGNGLSHFGLLGGEGYQSMYDHSPIQEDDKSLL